MSASENYGKGRAATELPDDLDWPLMAENVSREDLDELIAYLRQEDPRLTQGPQVAAFEEEWSRWLGLKHSVFVNSGSSANLITIAALAHLRGPGEVIVPPLTWVSDIAAVLHAGMKPVFVDIDPCTLAMDGQSVVAALTENTRAVFVTHVLGYCGVTRQLLDELARRDIPLIEDVCESHGATFEGRKLGSLGLAANFSFYYAHHMSTIEGGMVSTDDEELYQTLRILRSHGMVREASAQSVRERFARKHPDLRIDFIFAQPAYNVRSTELNAVLGRAQLRRLDEQNVQRQANLATFLDNLDPDVYRTNFVVEGNSNYAFTLVLRKPDTELCERVMSSLQSWGVEFRRGLSGGGNQLRQPYLRERFPEIKPEDFPNAEHVHFFGMYIGNYPSLTRERILELCRRLNSLAS